MNRHRRRVSLDDEILRKNRRIIDNYLRRLGPHIAASTSGSGVPFHANLALNNEGVCCFPYRKFVVVIEVAEDHPYICFLYTLVCRLNFQTDNVFAVMKHALDLNNMHQGTRGATIGLSDDEVNLCRTFPVAGLSATDLQHLVDDFLVAAVDINRRLDNIKKSSGMRAASMPSLPAVPENATAAGTATSRSTSPVFGSTSRSSNRPRLYTS